MSIPLRSVLISDAVDESCAALLASYGVSVTQKVKMSKEELLQEIQKHDALIVRSETKVTAELINAAPNLRMVGRAGTGVDNIDLDAAVRKGIYVLNTPGGNSISACEMTCALITSLARNVAQASQSLKEGRWDRKLYSGNELFGKTLAVLGLGRIGKEVAHRMQSYGMGVIAFDPVVTAESIKDLGIGLMSLDEIWPLADYITVHTPLIPQTTNLINATALAKCKKGVRVINVARGGIVDEKALLESIKAGHCGGAALDVFIQEPPKDPIQWELIKHPKVIPTPHLGASTAEAQQRVAEEIAAEFLALSGISTKYTVTGLVSSSMLSAAFSRENLPWVDLSKKLGQLAGKFLKKNQGATVEIVTVGRELVSKQFIPTAVLVGVLSGQTKNGLSLANAEIRANESGVRHKIKHENEDGRGAVVVKVGQHQVKGTVRENEILLLSVDNADFARGVILGDNVTLYHGNGAQDITNIVTTLSSKGANIHSLNANSNWFVVQTNQESAIQVNGIEIF